ncbi:sensor histidine kinase [Rugosimonospora acidiphila]
MSEPIGRPAAERGALGGRLSVILAGISGCLFLTMSTSSSYTATQPDFFDAVERFQPYGVGWGLVAAPIVATVVGLCALRWWPYLLLLAGLLAVPPLLSELAGVNYPIGVTIVCTAGYPLAIIGVLACAQGLAGSAMGWASALTGLTLGARLFGVGLGQVRWGAVLSDDLIRWHTVLVGVGLVGLVPVVWGHARGDRAAAGGGAAGAWSWPRLRLIVAGTLATCVVIPLSLLTTQRLADLLGVTWSALYRHGSAEMAVIGAITLVVVGILAAVAGPWSLTTALTAATIQVAVVAPVSLAVMALVGSDPTRLLGALAGVALGMVAAGNRWRFPLAGALAVSTAMILFIAYVATTGLPEKLAEQRSLIPALLILVAITAAATAVVGATAPVLATRGALPAALGPLAGILAEGGLQTIEGTYRQGNLQEPVYHNPVYHTTTSAVLLLVAGAAIGGVGVARQLAVRRAERQHTEQIRREAAAAERERLARPIHDGVLQVLALVQRQGSELGGEGGKLAALAGEQEVALRSLLTGGTTTRRGASEDLRTPLLALASPAIEVSAPAGPVVLAALAVTELTAAVRAALDNVRQHAGPGARAWVLVEDEQDGVRVTVRDDGVGFGPERLDEATEAGRLGVAQSMRGRIADSGGTTTIHSNPGEGTEVEFWVPRKPPAGR